MNTRSSNADPVLFLIVAVVVAAAFGIYQLASTLGLDFKTMLGVLLLSATVVALAGLCVYFGRDAEFVHISETWPLLLALEYMAWWPAMNVWAAGPLSAYMPDFYPVVWWNAWYTRAGVLAVCIGAWFLLRHRRTSYY
ncbi:hypothetical protein [Azohydromonas lata]|uniref:hypothetical protein n=1 Tax=Azohydromonas lata TaxID=45677 RepID=UPI0008321503|nr:hypothetical protein [Azohydromonas lata]